MNIASLSVGIDGNLAGFERTINRATGLLTQFEARGTQSGRAFDQNFGNSVARTAQRVGNGLDQINSRIALLTQRRSLTLDTSVLARTNQELASLQARASQLQNIGLPAPSSGATSGLLSYAGGFLSVGAAINVAKRGFSIIEDFDRLDRRLQSTSTSQADYSHSQDITRRLSDRLGISLDKISGSYINLKASSEGTSLAGKETDRIFEAIIRRSAKLGSSNEQTERSLLAISQAMSKGVLSAEEIRGQLAESLPGASSILAKSLGVTTAELDKMFQSGSILASDAIPKLSTELLKMSEGAEANTNSISGGFQRAQDQLGLLIGEFGKTAGIDSFFAKVTNGLANSLKGIRELARGGQEKKDGGGFGDFFNKRLTRAFPLVGAVEVLASAKSTKLEDATGRADAKQDFAGKDFAGRTAYLVKLKADINRSETDLASRSKDTVIPSFQMERERQALASKKLLLIDLRRENLLLAKAEQESAKSTTGVKLNPLKTYEALKKERDALEQKRKDLAVNNKLLDRPDANRLATLDAQLKRAEPPKAPKQTSAKDTYLSAYDLLSRKLAEAKKQAVDFKLSDKAIPDELLNRIDSLTDKLKVADGLFERLKLTGDIRQLALRTGNDPKRAADRFAPTPTKDLININQAEGGINALVATLRGIPQLANNAEKSLIGVFRNAKPGFNADNAQDKFSGQGDTLNRAEQAYARYQNLPPKLKRIAKSLIDETHLIDVAIKSGSKKAGDLLDGKANRAMELIERLDQYAKQFDTSGGSGGFDIGADVDGAKADMATLPGFIAKIAANSTAATNDFGKVGNAARKQLKDVAGIFKGFQEGLGQGVAGVFEGLGESFVTGTADPFKSALDTIIDTLANFAIQLGTSMLLSSKLLAFAAPLLGGTILPLSIGQGIVGAALIVGGGAIKAVSNGRKKFATGGYVTGPGSETSDSIPARLSRGEYVVRAAAVRGLGIGFLDQLNQRGTLPFAAGGAVQSFPNPPTVRLHSSPVANIPVENFKNLTDTSSGRIEVAVSGKSRVRGSDIELTMARKGRTNRLLGRG